MYLREAIQHRGAATRQAFLDVLMLHQPDGSSQTSVYRKGTHTNCYMYLDYDSHHPLSHKKSVVGTQSPYSFLYHAPLLLTRR